MDVSRINLVSKALEQAEQEAEHVERTDHYPAACTCLRELDNEAGESGPGTC